MFSEDNDYKLTLNPSVLSKTQSMLLAILGYLFVLQALINLFNSTKLQFIGWFQIVFGFTFIIISLVNFSKISHPNFIRISRDNICLKQDKKSKEVIISAEQINRVEISNYSFKVKSTESEYAVTLVNLSQKQRRVELRQFVDVVNKFKEINNIK